jgi:hypothetical protein
MLPVGKRKVELAANIPRLLFDWQSIEPARGELMAGIQESQTCMITFLNAAARKLMAWKPFILNWYKHRISNGKLEVMNRKEGCCYAKPAATETMNF